MNGQQYALEVNWSSVKVKITTNEHNLAFAEMTAYRVDIEVSYTSCF